jgi:hypothetical protein
VQAPDMQGAQDTQWEKLKPTMPRAAAAAASVSVSADEP